jgi:hypothetical protein
MCPFDIWMSKVQVVKAHIASANYKYSTKFLYIIVSRTFSATISFLDKNIALRHNLTPIYATKMDSINFHVRKHVITNNITWSNKPLCVSWFSFNGSIAKKDLKMWPLIGWFLIKWTFKTIGDKFCILSKHNFVFPPLCLFLWLLCHWFCGDQCGLCNTWCVIK